MSFWDKIQEAGKWVEQTGAPAVGGAFSAANHFVTDIPVVGGFVGGLEDGTLGTLSTVGKVDAWAYDHFINYPLSTALQVGADWDTTKHAITHPGDFVTAWNRTMDTPTQKGISWGRAIVLDYNHTGLPLGADALYNHDLSNDSASAGFSVTPEAQAAREKYFQQNWQAKFASGTIDLFGNVAMDPLAAAGKLGKGALILDKTFEDANQLNRVMDASKGAKAAEDLSKKDVNLTNTVVDIVTKHTEDRDATAISKLPWFRRSSNGGVFAGLMAHANEKFAGDATARFQAKQQILGAMLGHKGSLDALRSQQADLAAEVDALLKPPPTATYGVFTFDDSGKAVWEGANAEAIPQEVLEKADAIEQQAGRLAQVVGDKQGRGGAALSDLRGGGMMNNVAFNFRQSHILTGYAAKPIRVIAATASNRLPGYISTIDTHNGFQQLKTYLTKAVYLDQESRDQILNDYMAAGTKERRAQVLESAVEDVNASIAAQHGVKPLTAKALAGMGKKTSDVIRGVIRTRMYSADPKANTVMVHDPFAGEHVAIPRPIAQTQIADAVVMPDPLQLAKVYKTYAGHRFLDHIPKIGTPAADLLYGPIKDAAEMIAHAYTAVWRFTTLLNPGYPLRVLSDAVLRANIYMGPVQYLAQQPALVKAIYKAGRSDKSALSDMLKGNTQKVMTQYWKDMGFSEEEIPYILQNVGASGGSLADVASETADRLHGKVAGTGQWSAKHPGEPGYNADYIRAVNQIRESPTLMAAVRGLEGDSLRNFVYSNAAARREWMEMRHSNENDIDAWLARVEAHVNSVLPTNEARAWVSGNDVLDAAENVAGFKPRRLPSKRMKVDNPNKPGKKMLVPNPEYDRIVQENAKNAQQRIATLMESDGYRGRSINDDLIQKWFPNGDGPIIHGENFNPAKADTVVNRTMDRLTKIRDGYYRFASEGPDNLLARAPQYRYVYFQELNRIKKTLGKEATLEDMNLARRTADQIARREVGRTAFNSSNTSRLAGSFRYISPFYSAWEDTMRRYALLFYQKPWAPMRIGNLWDAPNRNGMLHDDYGNTIIDGQYYDAKTHRKLDPSKDLVGSRRFVTLPMNWLPKKVVDGLDATLGLSGEDLDINSINSVFQGDPWWLPGTGPLVQVPMNDIVRDMFPESEDNPIIRYILPFGTNDKSMTDISPDGPWMPTKYQHLKDAFGDGKDFQETLKNIRAYDTELHIQGKGPQPNIEEESRKARMFLILKAGLNWASPVRLEPDQDGQFYIDQAKIYRNKFIQDPKVLDQYIGKYGHDGGLMKFQQDYPSWEEKFYQDFPHYFLMGASLSANESGIVATIKAANEADKYMPFIKQNRDWGWLVAGPANQYGDAPDTKFSQAALNHERANGLRTGHDATDAVDSMAKAQGWIQYQAAATKVNLLYEKMGITKSDRAAEPYQKLLSSYAKKLGEHNIAFANDFGSMDTQKSLMALSTAFEAMDTYKNTKNDLRTRPDMRAIQEYAVARNKVIMLLAQRSAHSLTAKSNADIANLWDRYTQTLIKNNIGFEQLYNRVLSHDKLDILFDPSSAGGMGKALDVGTETQTPDGQ